MSHKVPGYYAEEYAILCGAEAEKSLRRAERLTDAGCDPTSIMHHKAKALTWTERAQKAREDAREWQRQVLVDDAPCGEVECHHHHWYRCGKCDDVWQGRISDDELDEVPCPACDNRGDTGGSQS